MRPRISRSFRIRCFLEYHMSVGSANSKRTYSSSTGQLAREPGTQFRIHIEWAVSKVDPRVGLLEVEAGHQHLVFQGERGLYETRDSGCCIKVSNVSLYRAEGAKLFWPGLPEGASQRRH